MGEANPKISKFANLLEAGWKIAAAPTGDEKICVTLTKGDVTYAGQGEDFVSGLEAAQDAGLNHEYANQA